MCGFVGFFTNGYGGDRNAVIKAMADRIIHRGPDQDDYYVDDDMALGFRRLSIIDLEGGSQPILNEDGTKVLVFNGEIYNFQELRKDLLAKGHVFKTSTDSEVLLHGYEEYGAELLQKLDDTRLACRAKCLLVERLHLTEDEAHHCLERRAMDLRVSRREAALTVIRQYED